MCGIGGKNSEQSIRKNDPSSYFDFIFREIPLNFVNFHRRGSEVHRHMRETLLFKMGWHLSFSCLMSYRHLTSLSQSRILLSGDSWKTSKNKVNNKGQLNSKWIYEVIVSPKMPTKNFKDFCPTKQTRIVAKKPFYMHQKITKKSATILVCLLEQKTLSFLVSILGEMMTS